MDVVRSDPQRVHDTLAMKEVDRPAMALSLALQAARTLNRSVTGALQDTRAFAEAQLAMHDRWQHDVVIAMFYAAIEAVAMGSDVLFYDDGPPNAGAPILRTIDDIDCMDVEAALDHPELARTEELIARVAEGLNGTALVSGVCVGPLSGPVMLAGMEHWLDMLLLRPDEARQVVERYTNFALRWADRQVAAGADAITWFEPLASTDMLPLPIIERMALPALREVCRRDFPVALHLASARASTVAPLALDCGISILSAGRFDDLAALQAQVAGRAAIIGNLDGVSMAHWEDREADHAVHGFLELANQSPGLILSDAHGEIPYQVAPETLDRIVGAARRA